MIYSRLGLWAGAISSQIMPVTAYELEAGIFELRYNFSRPIIDINHSEIWRMAWSEQNRIYYENIRIVVDTNNIPIQSIRYYDGETELEMIRYVESELSRYMVEAIDGGIRLAWRLPRLNVYVDSSALRLYRSTVQGERGVLVSENELWNMRFDSTWLYEFIDTDVAENETYYYSLWTFDSMDAAEQSVLIGGEWQMTVSLPLER